MDANLNNEPRRATQQLESEEFDIRQSYPLQEQVAREAGWDDPAMDEYNDYLQEATPVADGTAMDDCSATGVASYKNKIGAIHEIPNNSSSSSCPR